MKLTDHFDSTEFACKDGTQVPDPMLPTVRTLAMQLEVIRAHFNAPVIVISGYRTGTYNRKIGGAKRSRHLIADAADIRVKGVKPRDVADAVERLIAEGKIRKGGVGRYDSFTHYDIRGYNSRWVGPGTKDA